MSANWADNSNQRDNRHTPNASDLVARRACDSCKRRKVKCDSSSKPCSNCHTSRLQCNYTILPQKRGPKRRRLAHEQASQSTFSISVEPNDENLSTPRSQGDDLTPAALVMDPQYPLNVLSASSPESGTSHRHSKARSIQQVKDDLTTYITTNFSEQSPRDIANQCITLFLDYLFPIAPIVHEASLRSLASLLDEGGRLSLRILPQPAPSFQQSDMVDVDMASVRGWTLLTALCAAAAFLLPSSIFPLRDLVGPPFLQASREMSKYHQDYDIEHPDYISLAIGYYHSNALHAMGRTRVSWHVLGEAVRLTQEMRLFDERSFEELDPLEARLRRNIFWQIHTADKSASILNNCPIALHETCLGFAVTARYHCPYDAPLLSLSPTTHTEELESQIISGFDLCQDLWTRASNIVLKMNSLKFWNVSMANTAALIGPTREAITTDYLLFVSTLDHVQPDAKIGELTSTYDEVAITRLKRSLSIQKANLLVTYHCLRLVLLQKFSECGLSEMIGIGADAHSIALRKTEIASDMIKTLSEIPFEALQVNGEPCVEKLRRVGMALLETIQEIHSSSLTERAKSLFFTLLDVLARLDSRVSEELDINRGF